MSRTYVFDTEPLVAFLYREPGHDRVRELLETCRRSHVTGLLNEMNATEIFYLISRFEGVNGRPTTASIRHADRDLRSIERYGLTIRGVNWLLAAKIKAHGGLSLADACGVALAQETAGTLVVGNDSDFEDLPVDVPTNAVTTT